MEKELMIEGFIYHGPGNCPECGRPLVVVDSELTVLELNTEGIPIDSGTTFIRAKAKCVNCHNTIPMMRWKGGYVPYTESSRTLKLMELRDEARHRIAELNKKGKETNPFL